MESILVAKTADWSPFPVIHCLPNDGIIHGGPTATASCGGELPPPPRQAWPCDLLQQVTQKTRQQAVGGRCHSHRRATCFGIRQAPLVHATQHGRSDFRSSRDLGIFMTSLYLQTFTALKFIHSFSRNSQKVWLLRSPCILPSSVRRHRG